MNHISYFLTPVLAWLIAGALKFLINSLRARRLAFDLIGYGGLPSNHTAIVSSIASFIALKDGISNPAFGVAIALAFIVILDAGSLRREVGKHAVAINQLNDLNGDKISNLRVRIGHTLTEILAGVAVGFLVGFYVYFCS
ncbi:divergent PAP2 family protein [Polynucleobacter paneuropaeus]|nr:divergent PAP2 family protein [Polynucleobacter paneuropaeus]